MDRRILWLFFIVTQLRWIVTRLCKNVNARCFVANFSSQARPRLFGPFTALSQFDCALACSCAGGVEKKCSALSQPKSNCLAYSFDHNSMACALLGDWRLMENNVCSEPKTIYELRRCDTSTNITLPDSKCGPITLDSKVLCNTDKGYVCPEGYLPYLAQTQPKMQYISGPNNNIYLENPVIWALPNNGATLAALFKWGQNISCIPTGKPTYPKCAEVMPRLLNAVLLGDTLGCMPGYTFDTFTSRSTTYRTIPVCTAGKYL